MEYPVKITVSDLENSGRLADGHRSLGTPWEANLTDRGYYPIIGVNYALGLNVKCRILYCHISDNNSFINIVPVRRSNKSLCYKKILCAV
jgi:hypothetical protein